MKTIKEYNTATLCRCETLVDYKFMLDTVIKHLDYWKQQDIDKWEHIKDGMFFMPTNYVKKTDWKQEIDD